MRERPAVDPAPGPTLLERIRRLEEAYPPAARLALDLAGVPIEIASNAPELIRGLGSYFRERARAPADVGSGDCAEGTIPVLALEGKVPAFAGEAMAGSRLPGKEPKERYQDLPDGRVVHKVRTGMAFLMTSAPPVRNVAVGPCLANEPQVVNFVNNRFIQARLWEGSLLAHAACVAVGGRGLAIAGPAGRGKSTLALALMSRGASFVGNDRLLLREEDCGVRADGVAKHPRVNPGTLLGNPDLHAVLDPESRERFRALGAEALWHLEHKLDARIDLCYGAGRFPMTARLEVVFVLGWARGVAEPPAFAEVDLAARRDLLPAIIKAPGLFFSPRPGQERWPPREDDYVALLARTRVIEVTGGIDFDRAAERGLELLGGAPCRG